MATYWYFNDEDNVYHFSSDSDYVYGYGGNDFLYGGDGDDTLDGGAGNDYLSGENGNDKLLGGTGNDLLEGGSGNDIMIGGAGLDTYYVDSVGDVVVEAAGGGTNDTVNSYINYTLSGNVENLILMDTASTGTGNGLNNSIAGNYLGNNLRGEGGNDTLYGYGGDDYLYGGAGNDTLYGLDGFDSLYGDAGNDTLDGGLLGDSMFGGAGNDQYFVESGFDEVSEWIMTSIRKDTGGIDTVWSSIDYTLGDFVENLNLQGIAANGTGNDLANVIIGNTINNILSGNGGNDTLKGGQGDDHLHGGSGNDILYGEEGNDNLYGEDGSDIMLGGAGSDIYYVRQVTDKVYETTTAGGSVDAGGYDLVASHVDFTLGNFIEALDLSSGHATKGTGNSLDNDLYGNDEANIFDGKAGNDYMAGYDGSDTYYVDSQLDVIYEAPAQGYDKIISTAPSYTLPVNVENLTLAGYAGIEGTGNAGGNQIYGNSGANILSGGAGYDHLFGGAGNDTMFGGDDPDGLDGGAGDDVMFGGAGNDIYYVGSTGDKVYETTTAISNIDTGGEDRVYSSVSYTLGQFVENLTLTGSAAISGTGNDLNNRIWGNSAANTLRGGGGSDILDGGTGNDIMFGGAGDDDYYVNSAGDKVYETTTATSDDDPGGTDWVFSSISYTLGLFVENLYLSGTANINGTGNELSNDLYGNSGDNILDGGAGSDDMIGWLGNDTYIVNASDIVSEQLDAGIDTVKTGSSYTLPANVENLTFTGTADAGGTGNGLDNILIGNTGDNQLEGGDGNDTLNGGAGGDRMIGGAGNDTYYVDDWYDDVLVEDLGAGTDTVFFASSISGFGYGLVANVENLILTGSTNLDGLGNLLNNILIGNSGRNYLNGGAGDDTLNGGAGIDQMVGGTGNDIYWIDAAGDSVTELIGEGTDTIYSTVSYTLAAGCYCENLYLNGTAAINATGNNLSNHLYGNARINILSGLGGMTY